MLLLLQLLWGLVLWFSISKYGVGVSTDSIHMLFGGMNWWAGNGLTSYDGSFLILWPPLYSIMLGLVHGISGLSMIASATVLQAMAYAGVSICLAVFCVRAFPRRHALAGAACLLSDIGVVVLTTFDTAGSDYLQLLLILLFVLLIGKFAAAGSPSSYIGMAAVAMLAMLNRYLGLAVLATGVLCLLVLARGSLLKRLANSAVLATTTLPMAVWFGVTSSLYTRRPPISFWENFDRFSESILGWFLGPARTQHGSNWGIPLLWIAVLGLVTGLIMLRVRRSRDNALPLNEPSGGHERDAYLLPLLMFGAIYATVLFGAASMAYSNKLAGRFLLPVYIPLLMLPVAVIDEVLRLVEERNSAEMRSGVRVVCYVALVGIASMLLSTTMPVVFESHTEGAVGGENAYNNSAWHDNQAMQYWMAHTPPGEYRLISNQPDGVAFLTEHRTEASPRRTSGPYGTEVYPLSGYTADLFGRPEPVYLVWIDAKACTYCYSVDELRSIANVHPLMEAADGGVYRLVPR